MLNMSSRQVVKPLLILLALCLVIPINVRPIARAFALYESGSNNRYDLADHSNIRMAASATKYRNLPLSFEPIGQEGNTSFLSRGQGYGFNLTPNEVVVNLMDSSQSSKSAKPSTTSLAIAFAGARHNPLLKGLDPVSGKSNYFIGRDPAKWRTGVAHYARVKYEAIYPGIDALFYGNQRQLEYDFMVAPGADPARIKLDFKDVDAVSINSDGDLIIRKNGGDIVQRKPVAYQDIAGQRRTISAVYTISNSISGGREVGINLGAYDTRELLVIDPIVAFSTYFGGSNPDGGTAITTDSSGFAYITGNTVSTDFPTVNAEQSSYGGGFGDAFISKISIDGSTIIYSTYLGGNSLDSGKGIAVDSSGNAYVTGVTTSQNFPTVSAFQPSWTGNGEASFVASLNSSGSSLRYSTYLAVSGPFSAEAAGIAVDSSGSAYVTGRTDAQDFPTMNPIQPTNHAFNESVPEDNAFITKLSPNGSSLVYSTYLGGSGQVDTCGDQGNGIAVDLGGNAYVTGSTCSADFPTANALFSTFHGDFDAFVTKINAAGSALVYSTYLGGEAADVGYGITTDEQRNAYVTGTTRSTGFTTTTPFQLAPGGGYDLFVSVFNQNGSNLVYSTRYGGSGDDFGRAIAVDRSGQAVVTGDTSSPNFPIANAFQTGFAGGTDAFIMKLSTNGETLLYSTYLGGTSLDSGFGVAVGIGGCEWVTGYTQSTGFPTRNRYQSLKGSSDAFITKVCETPLLGDDFTSPNLDTNKWTINIFSGTQDRTIPIRQSNGRLKIGPLLQNTSDSHYNGISSVQSYDFTGAYASVQVALAAASNTTAYTMFTVGFSASNYYRLYIVGTSLIAQKKINGTKTDLATVPYVPGNMPFLRIRHDAFLGHVVFEVASDDGGTPGPWTTIYTDSWDASAVPLSRVFFELKAGTSAPESNPPGSAIFDNFWAARP
jgi:hypothetical protein